jgi:hypothetical protein
MQPNKTTKNLFVINVKRLATTKTIAYLLKTVEINLSKATPN